MSNRDLLLFLFKVFALFIIFLARVYAVSPFLSLFLVKAVNAVMTELFPRFIQSITLKNNYFEVVTFFAVPDNPKGQFDPIPISQTS